MRPSPRLMPDFVAAEGLSFGFEYAHSWLPICVAVAGKRYLDIASVVSRSMLAYLAEVSVRELDS